MQLCNAITISLTIFLTLYLSSLWFIHNWKPCTSHFPPSILHIHPYPIPSGNHQFVLCIYGSVSAFSDCLFICFVLFCFFDSTYKPNHMVFVFLWLISLSKMHSRPIHVVINGKSASFLWLSSIPLYIYTHIHICVYMYMCVYVYIYMPHLYLFIYWWTLGLLPCFVYCK